MIELVDVFVAFGDKVVLDGLSLTIPRDTTTVIVGRSGSGKTVLLKTMLGLIRPTRGTVRLFGRDLATVSEVELVELRRHVGMLFQNYALFDGMSVEHNVEFPLEEGQHVRHDLAEARAKQILALLGLAGSEALLPASAAQRSSAGAEIAAFTRGAHPVRPGARPGAGARAPAWDPSR